MSLVIFVLVLFFKLVHVLLFHLVLGEWDVVDLIVSISEQCPFVDLFFINTLYIYLLTKQL